MKGAVGGDGGERGAGAGRVRQLGAGAGKGCAGACWRNGTRFPSKIKNPVLIFFKRFLKMKGAFI